jgi:stage II sporulation protein D
MRTVRALGAIGLGSTVIAGALLALPAEAAQTYYVPITDRVVVRGHGYGHGNGMSQYGAEGAARQGKTYRQILARYYPGTRMGTTSGRIRVLITADTTSDLKVSPAQGLTLRDRADGRTWRLPARPRIDRWRLLPTRRVQFYNGNRWRRWAVPGRTRLRGQGEVFAQSPIRLWVPSGSGEVGRRYRGALRAARPSAGSSDRDTVNVLTMDRYLRGVVPAEMPASWSQAALRSQAVAARTYAARDRAANHGRYYQTCDTTSCQVYGGVASEFASTNRAVRATARKILRYRGEPAFTQFSSSSGGYTGDGGHPYLRPVRDPWDNWAGNPMHRWRTTINTRTIERRYPSIGRLRAIRIVRRNGFGHWGGRVLRMRLDGGRADRIISGDDFRWMFGLRSNWFKIEDTAIMARWKRIGARSSVVGRPVGAERPAGGRGAVQKFRKGRIFWLPRIGARETYGPILRRYLAEGGTTSGFGYPRTAVKRVGRDGRMVVFQHGRRLYRNPPTGVHQVRHGWLRAYRRAGWARGIGLPKTDVFRVKRGKRMRFDRGAITRDRRGRYHVRSR